MTSWINWLKPGRKRAGEMRRSGNAARDARDWPRAVEAYRAYLAMRPDDWPIRVQLGHACKESGDLAAAERAYREAAAWAPGDADVWLQLGHLLKLAGRPEEAKDAYRRSTELDPAGHAAAELAVLAGATPRRGGTAAASRDRDSGDLTRDAGQWLLAAHHYSAHLKIHPHDWPIWVQLGHMLKEAGKLAEAELAYRRAIQLDATAADAFLHLGHLLKLTGKREAAIEAYRRSAALDPDGHATVELTALGVRPTESVIALADLPGEDASGLEFATASLSREARWRILSDAHGARDQCRWNDAAALYREFLLANANAWKVWTDLAMVLRHAGRYHEAYDAIRRATSLEPDAVALLREKGLILRHLGKIEEASALFMGVMQKTGSAELRDEAGRVISLF